MMRILRLILSAALFSLCVSSALGQKLRIESFAEQQGNIYAQTNPRLDANNQRCALVIVYISDDITTVEGQVVGDIVKKQGMEKWIYLENGTKTFVINTQNHFPLVVNFAENKLQPAVGGATYKLNIIDESAGGGSSSSSTLSSGVAVKSFNVNGVYFRMIKVDGGTFMMGSDEGESDEKPRHQVTLSDYYIGETEVTQALWKAVMGKNPSEFKGDGLLWKAIMGKNPSKLKSDNLPVEKVSWIDCQEFISKLNAATGETFSLPTEAQWEFAARGGNKSKGYKYSGSNNIDDVAWYKANSGNKTHTVATKQPNELGLYDMSGNVSEWCNDWYDSYVSYPQTNPESISTRSYRVIIRGGGWNFDARNCRASSRDFFKPGSSYKSLGLRLSIRK